MQLALQALPPLSMSTLFRNLLVQWNPFHFANEPNFEKVVKWALAHKVIARFYSNDYIIM